MKTFKKEELEVYLIKYGANKTKTEIANEFGVAYSTVYLYAQRLGITLKTGVDGRRETEEIKARILWVREYGHNMTIREISAHFRISYYAADQMVYENNLPFKSLAKGRQGRRKDRNVDETLFYNPNTMPAY